MRLAEGRGAGPTRHASIVAVPTILAQEFGRRCIILTIKNSVGVESLTCSPGIRERGRAVKFVRSAASRA